VDPDFELLSERLRLRAYRPDDVELLEPMLSDPEHMRWYPAPYSHEQVVDWVERRMASYERVGFGLWIVEKRSTGGFLGTAGPTEQVVEQVREVELGWHVRKEWWGQGIAAEAAAASRDWAWDHLDLDHLIALVRPENRPSARVAEKIGMRVDRDVEHMGFRHHVYRIDRPG
jgi:ribosomal-protein-alanine N-acetyltransferase